MIKRIVMGTALVALILEPLPASAASATVVAVSPGQTGATVSPLVLGGNGRWAYDNFGAWNPATQSSYPGYVTAMQASAMTTTRYPGGTIANLYHWEQAIGPLAQRVDQVHGSTGEPLDNDYGPDEYGRFTEQMGQQGSIVVNFSTGTPQEAADWVEYMTGVVGQNLNGGTDWAAVRAANGHPAPYSIPYWEVGNEMSLSNQFYWRSGTSATDPTTLYALGGSASFTNQRVGKQSDYRDSAAVSDGTGGQSFVAKYAPVSAAQIFVGGTAWTQTTNLPGAAATAQVFTLDAQTGAIGFGDGVHGKIPPSGSVVTISYTSGPHAGFVDFYAAMKKANPDIKVCGGLSGVAPTQKFAQIMGTTHPYDCVEDHAYIDGPTQTNIDADEYYGRLMLESGSQQSQLVQMQQAVAPAGASVVVSEYGQLGDGHPDANPNFHASLSEALLMATNVDQFISHGVPLADKSNLTDFVHGTAPGGSTSVGAPLNAMIAGPGPNFIVQPTGLVPNIYATLGGSTVVGSAVSGNPVRTLENGSQLPALTTLAARAANGDLNLIVINQDPENATTANVQPGVTHAATAQTSTLNGTTILSRNLAGDLRVKVTAGTVQAGTGNFDYTFPAHSVTRILLTGTSN